MWRDQYLNKTHTLTTMIWDFMLTPQSTASKHFRLQNLNLQGLDQPLGLYFQASPKCTTPGDPFLKIMLSLTPFF